MLRAEVTDIRPSMLWLLRLACWLCGATLNPDEVDAKEFQFDAEWGKWREKNMDD